MFVGIAIIVAAVVIWIALDRVFHILDKIAVELLHIRFAQEARQKSEAEVIAQLSHLGSRVE